MKALLDAVNNAAFLPGVMVKRNVPEAVELPSDGLVVLRDGDPGEPEETLSPLSYWWEHRAEIVVQVQRIGGADRDAVLDGLLVALGEALMVDRTLGGLVEMLTVGAPSMDTEPVQGAAAIKSVIVPVTLEYETASPLG
jgi:hypothetical protein